MISAAALDDLRARNPVTAIAGKWVRLRRAGKAGWMVGPCPLHSKDPNAKDSTSFECTDDRWVCASCADGGDVIRLVSLRERIDFLAAIAWLGGAQQVYPAEAARREQEAARKKAEQERASARFREAERERMWALWKEGRALPGTAAELYLARRLRVVERGEMVPRGALLRGHAEVGYWVTAQSESGRARPRCIHKGPALLAAIIGPEGRFAGLHTTWIDLDQPKGKLKLVHPETGELLPAKKVRGSLGGGRIELVRHAAPRRLFIGEGIETVLSIWRALRATGRLRWDDALWSGAALGNIGGKALGTVRHPTEKDAGGRARSIPGPEPDLSVPGIPIPDSVTDLVLLADADSDRFRVETTLARAAARFAAPGRVVRIAWPDEGRDFNDMLFDEVA